MLLVGLFGVVPAAAQSDAPVEVIVFSGPIDGLGVSFIEDAIAAASTREADVAILQISSPGALTVDVERVIDLIADPPLPVVVWVGPEPATAYGAAVAMLEAAEIGAAAPGVVIGYSRPIVAGGAVGEDLGADPALVDRVRTIRAASEPYVSVIAPTINNLLVELNGRTVTVGGQPVVLQTVEEREEGTVASQTVFREAGIGTRTLRLAVRPEAAFLFLLIGLTVAAFEFFAIGPGVAAGVGVVSLLLAGYGLVVLPLRWWALVLTLLGMWLLTVDFQRGRAAVLTMFGAVVLLIGGLFFTMGAPQIVPAWWAVVVTVISVVLFYMFAMTAVARSRFSTPTMGREHLIGRHGIATSDFAPNGEVDVGGARWLAAAHREAGIKKGDEITVAAIDGRYLEVEPVTPPT